MEFARTSPKSLKLILTARRINTLKEIAEEIKNEVGSGVQVLPLKLDVSNPSEVKGFVDSLPAEFREIDVLVNNAYALKMPSHILEPCLLTTVSQWSRQRHSQGSRHR